ncbi:hypothetical protein [Mitsuokella jalaludinii]|uniref:hypothetical protein n=1 Tax=Mitsuokella jalaludinii TaxID=187979 RepID=UPI002FDAB42E
MDSLKGFLAALAGIGIALGGTLFVIVAALVIIGLFFTGIFAMIGLSITMLAIAIEVGLAYIVGCIIHYIALRVLGWLYEVTHIGWLADYYHRNTAAVVIAVAGVLWIWFG